MRRWLAPFLALLLAIAAGVFLLRPSGPGDSQPGAVAATGPAATGASAAPPQAITAPLPDPDVPASVPGPPADGSLAVTVASASGPAADAEVRLWRRASGASADPWRAAGRGRTGLDGKLELPAPPGAYLVAASAPGLARALVDVVHPAGEARTEVALRLQPGSALSGRTVERAGGAAIPFATVVARPVRPGVRFRQVSVPGEERIFATSDARGEFRFPDLPPGPVEIEAHAPGHATGHWRDVAVPSSTALRLELVAAATIEGRVIRDGRPAPGARVTVLGTGEPVTLQAGPAGAFAAEVEPGTHRAFAQLGDATGTAGRLLQVAAGSVLRDVEIQLGPSAAIGGQVRAGSRPVEGATVVVALAGDARESAQARSGPDGAYELRPLRPGTYAVSVAAPGHPPTSVPGVTVRPGERFRLDLALAEPSAIEGTVTDGDGAPVPGALVSADAAGWGRGPGPGGFPSSAAPTVATRTDGSGRYAIEGLSAGPVRVAARRDPASPSAVKVVPVEEGERARADLSLVEGGVVAGTVRDASGSPVAGATVTTGLGSGPPRPGEVRQATADADGTYLLAMAPGTYGLVAARPGARFRPGARPGVLATVTLAAGQRVAQDLSLPPEPPPTVTGRVVEPGGAPAGGALVWSGALGPGMLATLADPDGAFSLAAPAGAALRISARNGGRTGSASVEAPAAGVSIPLDPGAALHGRLVGDPPPETFTVSISSRGLAPGGAPVEQQFAADTFDLDDVVPGQVSVHVRTSDGRLGDAQLTLASGESGTVAVTLSPAATVTGRLVDARTGAPIGRALVRVDGAASRRAGVAATGQFTRAVTEGEHELSVLAAGYQPLSRPFRAAAGAPTDLGDLPLVPGSARPAP